mmetsp:Transcript_22452/g.45014  ORF Transcript_22452/g.45014 Transcript_22452/m.45014 type:complete len:313 (-) Transcript_22452:287-1225(-)
MSACVTAKETTDHAGYKGAAPAPAAASSHRTSAPTSAVRTTETDTVPPPSSWYIFDTPARNLSASPSDPPPDSGGGLAGGSPPPAPPQRATAAARASRRAGAEVSGGPGGPRYSEESRSTDRRAVARGSSFANTDVAGGAEGSTRKKSNMDQNDSAEFSESSGIGARNAAACLFKAVSSGVSLRNGPTSLSSLATESITPFFGCLNKNPIKSRATLTATAPVATTFTVKAGARVDVGGVVRSSVGKPVGILVGLTVSAGKPVGFLVGIFVWILVGEDVGHIFSILPFEPKNILPLSFPVKSHSRHRLKADAP